MPINISATNQELVNKYQELKTHIENNKANKIRYEAQLEQNDQRKAELEKQLLSLAGITDIQLLDEVIETKQNELKTLLEQAEAVLNELQQ